MLSGRYWPIHLKPLRDELLSSWLVRLCDAHGLKPHTFCDVVWPKKAIWNRDIDKNADYRIVDSLARKTGVPFLKAFDTHLKSYEKKIFKRLNPFGNTTWIMPLGMYHRIRHNGGIGYCQLCLEESAFYRKAWRLAFTTVCVRHRCYLQTQCRSCGAPINFHRTYLIKKPFWCCYVCGLDLRERFGDREEALSIDVRRQLHLDVLIQEGAWYLGDGTRAASLDVFAVMHQLIKLLLYRKSGRCLWKVSGGIDADIAQHLFSGTVIFERFDNRIRNSILSRAYWFMTDWPNRLSMAAQKCDLSGSIWLRDMSCVPSWYLTPLLKRGIYTPML